MLAVVQQRMGRDGLDEENITQAAEAPSQNS
ncbi:hypothetical protein CABS01_06578 [Colletotrichum abscissum]|nr:uncharacterized protein CABS01_06578 [Colletotrichum abscissum]KAK1516611.1 hypothetical protein CABS01_06578 [Colletotrichum abscissum]